MHKYNRLGYTEAFDMLDRSECDALVAHALSSELHRQEDWNKSLAVSHPQIYKIAISPLVMERVTQILGNDIMLWSAALIVRNDDQVHPWHNDLECAVAEGASISVWIGLSNTTSDSGLTFVAGSHHFKKTIQEIQASKGRSRGASSDKDVLTWAKELRPDCTLVNPEISDGQAMLFDGWMWHRSHNRSGQTRKALLLQYATPDTPIRIPDFNYVEWPHRMLTSPKPPCIMVSGKDTHKINRIVSAPVSGIGLTLAEGRIHDLGVPLPINDDAPWQPFHQFRGCTAQLQHLTCHISALRKGMTPHPPHQHREEEILLLLDGEADVTLPDRAAESKPTTVRLKPGEFVYYPAWFYHTITAVSDKPANYIMLKWFNNTAVETMSPLKYIKANALGKLDNNQNRSFNTGVMFNGGTDCLNRLQAHITDMQPGGGYEPHSDAYDVVIITLEGEVETLGSVVKPNSVIFYPSGTLHGMKNNSDVPARYLVFEFHGKASDPLLKYRKRSLWTKLRSKAAWKRKAKEVFG